MIPSREVHLKCLFASNVEALQAAQKFQLEAESAVMQNRNTWLEIMRCATETQEPLQRDVCVSILDIGHDALSIITDAIFQRNFHKRLDELIFLSDLLLKEL